MHLGGIQLTGVELGLWLRSLPGRARTIRGRMGSSSPGSVPTLTAWSGCAGRMASFARGAGIRVGGLSLMVASSAHPVAVGRR